MADVHKMTGKQTPPMVAEAVVGEEDELKHRIVIRGVESSTDRAHATLRRHSRCRRSKSRGSMAQSCWCLPVAKTPLTEEETEDAIRPHTAPPHTQAKDNLRRPEIQRLKLSPGDLPMTAVHASTRRQQYDGDGDGISEDLSGSSEKSSARTGNSERKYSSPASETKSLANNEKQTGIGTTKGQQKLVQSTQVEAKDGGGFTVIVGRHLNKLLTVGRRMLSSNRLHLQSTDEINDVIVNNMAAGECNTQICNTGENTPCEHVESPVVSRSTSTSAVRKTSLEDKGCALRDQEPSLSAKDEAVCGKGRCGERKNPSEDKIGAPCGAVGSETRETLKKATHVNEELTDSKTRERTCDTKHFEYNSGPIMMRRVSSKCRGRSSKLGQSFSRMRIHVNENESVEGGGPANGQKVLHEQGATGVVPERNDFKNVLLTRSGIISQCYSQNCVNCPAIKDLNGFWQYIYLSEANIRYQKVPTEKNSVKKIHHSPETIKIESKHLHLPKNGGYSNAILCDDFASMDDQKDSKHKLESKSITDVSKDDICAIKQGIGCKNQYLQNVYINNQMCLEIDEVQCRELESCEPGEVFVVTTDYNGNLILMRESELQGKVNIADIPTAVGKEDDAVIHVDYNNNCVQMLAASGDEDNPRKCIEEDGTESKFVCCELCKKRFRNNCSQCAEPEHCTAVKCDVRVSNSTSPNTTKELCVSPTPVSLCSAPPIRRRNRECCNQGKNDINQVGKSKITESRQRSSRFAGSDVSKKTRVIEGSLQDLVNRQQLLARRNDSQIRASNWRHRSLSVSGASQSDIRRIVDRGRSAARETEGKLATRTRARDYSEYGYRSATAEATSHGLIFAEDLVHEYNPKKNTQSVSSSGSDGDRPFPVTRLRGAGGGGEEGSRCVSESTFNEDEESSCGGQTVNVPPHPHPHAASSDVSDFAQPARPFLREKGAPAIGTVTSALNATHTPADGESEDSVCGGDGNALIGGCVLGDSPTCSRRAASRVRDGGGWSGTGIRCGAADAEDVNKKKKMRGTCPPEKAVLDMNGTTAGEVVIRVVGGSSGGESETNVCAVVVPCRGNGDGGGVTGSSGDGAVSINTWLEDTSTSCSFGSGFSVENLQGRCLVEEAQWLSPSRMQGGCSVEKSHVSRRRRYGNNDCDDVMNSVSSMVPTVKDRLLPKTKVKRVNPSNKTNALKKVAGSIGSTSPESYPESSRPIRSVTKSAAIFNFKECSTTFLQNIQCDDATKILETA